MKDLKYQLEHLEPLNLKEQGELHGGFISLELKEIRPRPNKNTFQCGCNNYCPAHRLHL